MAQPVDFLVDAGVLLNEGVRVGDICLRLIIVVVGDEILDSIVREKLLELRAELGGQRLVVGQNQRRTLHPLNDLGHGEGLAAAGDPLQGLLVQPQLDAVGDGVDGLRLIAGWLERADNFKFRHDRNTSLSN